MLVRYIMCIPATFMWVKHLNASPPVICFRFFHFGILMYIISIWINLFRFFIRVKLNVWPSIIFYFDKLITCHSLFRFCVSSVFFLMIIVTYFFFFLTLRQFIISKVRLNVFGDFCVCHVLMWLQTSLQ